MLDLEIEMDIIYNLCNFVTLLLNKKKIYIFIFLHFEDESVQEFVPSIKGIFLLCIYTLCRNICLKDVGHCFPVFKVL